MTTWYGLLRGDAKRYGLHNFLVTMPSPPTWLGTIQTIEVFFGSELLDVMALAIRPRFQR